MQAQRREREFIDVGQRAPPPKSNVGVRNHPVNVKVLRLSRPRLPPIDLTNHDSIVHPSALLSVPSYFGSAYIGERFCCVVSANNMHADKQLQVSVSAQVVLPSEQTVVLLHDSDFSSTLEPMKSAQKVLEYEAREPGAHVLNITVTYWSDSEKDSEKVSFRKVYQFQVTPGLSVRTKLSPAPKGAFTIEAQIENVSESTMTLETINYLPAGGWTAKPLPGPTQLSLLARDVYQMAFLVMRDEAEKDPEPIGGGRLSLSWRREPLGEDGWLTTGPLKT